MKFISLIFLILLLTSPVLAAETLLDAVTTINPTSNVAQMRTHTAPSIHTMNCYFTDADDSITAITVQLLGAIDHVNISDTNAHWGILTTYPFTSDDIATKNALIHLYNGAVTRVKANISVLTGGNGTTDSITCQYINGEM